jgi:antitoxin MazE
VAAVEPLHLRVASCAASVTPPKLAPSRSPFYVAASWTLSASVSSRPIVSQFQRGSHARVENRSIRKARINVRRLFRRRNQHPGVGDPVLALGRQRLIAEYNLSDLCFRDGRAMRVSKWDDGLAIRLPPAIVEALDFHEGDDVVLRTAGKRTLVIERSPSAKELLARLRRFRGRLSNDFKFDRSEANERR